MLRSPHHHRRGLSGSGYSLAIEKLEFPSQCITFLGITLDTQCTKSQHPSDELLRIRNRFSTWLTRKKATKREILFLVGLLQHACKVVKPGRSFMSRMYITTAKLKQLSHYNCLNKDFRYDLHWWNAFVSIWNRTSFLQNLSIRPILIAPSKLIPQDHGAVVHLLPSLVLVCFNYWMDSIWLKSWYPS